MATLILDAGKSTEELVQFITNEMDDATLDKIEVQREVLKPENLATEPFTVTATLVLSTTLVITVGRIIERWLENRKQLDQLRIVADGFKSSDEAGKGLAQVSKAHAAVSIAYGLPKVIAKK